MAVLNDITAFLPILLVIIYFLRFMSKGYSKAYNFFCVYLFFIAFVSVTTAIMANLKMNNLFYSHVYFMGEFLFLSLFFRQLLLKNQKRKADLFIITVLIGLALLIVLHSLDYFYLSPMHPLEILMCGVPILIFALLHLYNSYTFKLNFFYVTLGVFIYKTISILAFIIMNFSNSIEGFRSLGKVLSALNSIFLLVYYGLIFFEWFKNFRQKKVNS